MIHKIVLKKKKTNKQTKGKKQKNFEVKKENAILRVARNYFSNFIQLLSHILQQLGKVTIPFVEFQLLVI